MAYVGEWGDHKESFVHIPKTAGWEFRKYLKREFGYGQEIEPFHGVPPDIENGFAIVRHPIMWLRSLWTFRHNVDWVINGAEKNYWPVIIGMTQWAEGSTWSEFVDSLFVMGVDIPGIVFGMYRSPHVSIYQLENIHVLLNELGGTPHLPMGHVTPGKPKITPEQWQKLAVVCRRSIGDYGYLPETPKG